MKIHQICKGIVEHKKFERFIVFVIFIIAVVVGFETDPSFVAKYGNYLAIFEVIVLTIFILEIIIRLISEWPNPLAYFKNPWNLLDFSIVVVCLLPATGTWVSVVRLCRILRSLRLVTQIPKLRVLVGGLLGSLPSMGYVSVLLVLFFYLYAVMGTFLFAQNDPGHFGSLGMSIVTLFRVVTMEDWTDVMYSAYYGTDIYPAQGPIPTSLEPEAFGIGAILYFSSFVIIGAMIIINLFVGVAVNSLSDADAEELKLKLKLESDTSPDKKLLYKLSKLEDDLKEMKAIIATKEDD